MKSCGRARDVILLMLRQQATEAQRLFLDEHLAACAACREERASIGLLERLRDAPPSGLSSDARSRVLGQLLDTRPDVGRERTAERWRGPLWFALAAVPVVVIAIFVWRAMPAQPQAPRAQVVNPSPSLPQAPAVQRMSTTGETQLKGARFAEDQEPLDAASDCPASRDYSKAYLHHLVRSEEILGQVLLSWHNLSVFQRLMAAMCAPTSPGFRGSTPTRR